MSEKRYTQGVIEARSDGDAMTIVGHASVFNTPYELLGFREQVSPGAFKKSIKEGDIAALWNHDPNVVLGRKKSGTLRLSEDDHGLLYEVDLPNTQAARDLYTLIQRGDVYQSSFAFEVVKEAWDHPKKEENSLPLRTIKEVRLYDVSPVTYPASASTDVDVKRAVRSLAEAMGIEPVGDTVSELLARAQEDTPEPEPEPQVHSEPTPEPSPHFTLY